MELQNIKNNIVLLMTFLFTIIKCEGKPEDEINRLMEELDRKKKDHSNKKGEAEIYNVVITVLIATIIFFVILLISAAIYEIINCCMERKRESERKTIGSRFTKKSKKGSNNNSKISNRSSIVEEEKKIGNSFHSSHMSASIRSKGDPNNDSGCAVDKSNINSNYAVDKPNIKDSHYSNGRLNSGYEAPIVQNVVDNNNNIIIDNNIIVDNDDNKNDYYNNMNEKLLTNDGNIRQGNKDMRNPYES